MGEIYDSVLSFTLRYAGMVETVEGFLGFAGTIAFGVWIALSPCRKMWRVVAKTIGLILLFAWAFSWWAKAYAEAWVAKAPALNDLDFDEWHWVMLLYAMGSAAVSGVVRAFAPVLAGIGVGLVARYLYAKKQCKKSMNKV